MHINIFYSASGCKYVCGEKKKRDLGMKTSFIVKTEFPHPILNNFYSSVFFHCFNGSAGPKLIELSFELVSNVPGS